MKPDQRIAECEIELLELQRLLPLAESEGMLTLLNARKRELGKRINRAKASLRRSELKATGIVYSYKHPELMARAMHREGYDFVAICGALNATQEQLLVWVLPYIVSPDDAGHSMRNEVYDFESAGAYLSAIAAEHQLHVGQLAERFGLPESIIRRAVAL